MLHAGNQDEEADEKEDGDPLHLAEGVVDGVRLLLGVAAEVVEQQQQRGAEHGDGAGLQAEGMADDEAEDDQGQHGERLLQELGVGDRFAFVEVHHPVHGVFAGAQLFARQEVHANEEDGHDDDRDRRHVQDKVHE